MSVIKLGIDISWDENKRNVFSFVLKADRVEQCQKVMRE